MRIDISKSLQSPFSDQNWIMKVLIGTALQFLSFLLVPAFAVTGYYLKVLRQSCDGQDESLPEWDDWGALIISGLKYSLGVLILFVIPTALMIFGGGAMLMSLIAGFSGKSGAAAAGMAGGAMSIAALCIGSFLSLIITLLLPALSIRFAQNDSIGELFGFGQAVSDILRSPIDYLALLLVPVAAGVLSSLLVTLTAGLGSILLLPLGIILALGMARMQGSFYRNCLN